MDFRLLGSLEAVAGGVTADLGPPKQRALLAVLLLHAGEIVSVDRLIDDLWPEAPPRTAAHSIQIYVSELRKALSRLAPGELIVTRQPGYQLQAPDDAIDTRRFERLVEEGLQRLRTGDRVGGMERLRAALTLWRGPVLSDFAYEEFAQPYIRRLTDRHLDAIEELAAAELLAGLVADALSLVEAAVREDPLRERSREILMLALSRSGRHAEALRTYQRLRELLDDELGLDPSPALQQLQQRILLHDPSLAPASEVAAGTEERARNPYKGLRAFTEQDAADFFGRDDLADRLVDSLRAGQRLVALVGPSGSGKSSVLAAGLIPRVRAGAIAGSVQWDVVHVIPATNNLAEIEATVRTPAPHRRLLVLDQFEDLFAVADEPARRRFLQTISAALRDPDGAVTVVLALRADFYDRPLLDPAFAEIFIPGVMNVVPMTTDELKAAVAGPAERAGVSVEPGLLAELVADTVAQPAALPLLQFALTELFDRGNGVTLTLAEYRALGALHGILSRRAEALYGGLDAAGRQVAMQVFLRLVRPGRSPIDSRRRPSLSELTDLDVDPVALSEVLDSFGRHRLLAFDRDPVTGDATVEVAHEALLREWDRLAGWIDRHRAALRRHSSFASAAEEWEAADRDPDYLLTGTRLAEFETTIREGALQLTGRERAFLEASLERRRSEQATQTASAAASRRLERLARIRLVGLGIAVAAVIVLGGYTALGLATPVRAPVSLIYNGDGAWSVALIVQGGFDRAVTDFGLTSRKMSVISGPAADDAMRSVSQGGSALVVAAAVDANVDSVAADFPDTRYAVIDLPAAEPNVIHLAFGDNESSFLAGVVAAKTTRTGTIGFIGGADGPVIWPFAAGYEAGARAVDPSIRILSAYLGRDGDYEAYVDPAGASSEAMSQFRGGADVIFAAAGDSGVGVFSAATSESTAQGRQLWAIGVDSDQYVTVGDNPVNVGWRDWQPHILTSVLKRMDTAVYDLLAQYARGDLATGTRRLGLAAHGVDLSTSGGFIDGLRAEIDTWRARIVAGSVAVPCIPVGREAQAGALGIDPTGCGG